MSDPDLPAPLPSKLGGEEDLLGKTANRGELADPRLDQTADSGGGSGPGALPGAESSRGRGEQIGRFVVIAKLGEGGMGAVYAAHDPMLNRRVALKLLRRELSEAAHGGRMVREAQALAKLSHPNVVNVHDVGLADGRMFLAMEHIEGHALSEVLRDDLPWTRVLELFLEAGKGLAAAHDAGLIHRDFKPQNAMVGTDGRVRVLDFGLARDSGGEAAVEKAALPPDALASPLTRAGTVLGTPVYMSPEQLEGQPCDARTDQFSFCVSLWEGFYGERPFDGASPEELKHHVLTGKLKPVPKGKRVPAKVHQAVVKGLSPKREDRFPSMEALLAVLKPPTRRYPISFVFGLAGLTALLAFGLIADQLQRRTPRGWWARNKASCNPVQAASALQNARGEGGALHPGGPEADLYASACLALAGRFSEADQLAAGLPPEQHQRAGHLFYVLGDPVDDPVVDRGRASQLPMMDLALKHSDPGSEDHPRAAYYLAFAELEAGKPQAARKHLEYFLQLYRADDPWRRSAVKALAGLQ